MDDPRGDPSTRPVGGMRTVVLAPAPAELEALLARRRESGADAYDDVWEGVVHVAPMAPPWRGRVQSSLMATIDALAVRAGLEPCGPFNLGDPSDFRIPDAGVFDEPTPDAFVARAVLVVEVVSPDDETFGKFAFYADHGVREVLTADPQERQVRVWRLDGAAAGEAHEVEHCEVLDASAAALTAAVRWPSD